MKKILLLALSAAMLLSIVSCADPTIEQPEVDTNAPAADVGQLTEQPEQIEKINVTYELVKPFGTYKDPNAVENFSGEMLENHPTLDIIPAVPGYFSYEEFHVATQEYSFDNMGADIAAKNQYATQYYRPAVIPEGYVLDYILVYENEFMYYYKVKDPSYLTTSTYSNITVTVSKQASETAETDLEKLVEQQTDENGCIYIKYSKTLWTTINGYQVKITVSPDLNDYDTIRSLCELEKVTLVAGVGVVDNAVVDNALAVK